MELICRELVPRCGRGPALVFGQSRGNSNMLSEFADTRAGLIVNRWNGKSAPNADGRRSPWRIEWTLFLLGQNNNVIDLWKPIEASLQLDAAEYRLLAGSGAASGQSFLPNSATA